MGGSCTNYILAAPNMTVCNVLSQSMGCGDCKTSYNDALSEDVQNAQTHLDEVHSSLTAFATLCPAATIPACGDATTTCKEFLSEIQVMKKCMALGVDGASK